MKINWKKLLLHLAIPLGVGGLSALLTRESMQSFSQLNQPPLSPPPWLFGVVWTVLYLLMGFAAYRISVSGAPAGEKKQFWYLYTATLFFNFFWSLIFFNLGAYIFAFSWLVVLWVLILWMVRTARGIDPVAFWCLVPYLLWVSFAGYLNLGIALLN